MSTKHTPGPWVTERSGSVIWIGTPRSSGQKVDEIVTHIEMDLTYKTEVIEKKLANAKLIAAAPDMLASLKAITDAYHSTQFAMDVTNLINQAHRAIDKATK